MKRAIAAFALALGLIAAPAVLDQGHFTDAGASWSQCHTSQGIHELSSPPASWPGTRAAHTVQYLAGTSQQQFYTKSGWWDPTWDFYKAVVYVCP